MPADPSPSAKHSPSPRCLAARKKTVFLRPLPFVWFEDFWHKNTLTEKVQIIKHTPLLVIIRFKKFPQHINSLRT